MQTSLPVRSHGEAGRTYFSSHGLTAYSKHPLLRAAEIDHAYYKPPEASVFRKYAEQVPHDFRFLVKAHQDLLHYRFPDRGNFGMKRGAGNPLFLDAAHAIDNVVGPTVEGLGSKLGILLFQFPPQDAGDPWVFAARLHDFFSRLPRGVPYAVEVRNAELITAEYGRALADAGVVHCHNVWTKMPTVLDQARHLPLPTRRPFLVRWLLRQGEVYEDAADKYAPFDRIRSEDIEGREDIARLVVRAQRSEQPVFVMVDNKAEGCSPASVVHLARSIARQMDEQGRSL